MAKSRLSPTATYVAKGYGQVEPNHLSAQYNGKIHAQWPADANINLLENGQFVKYNPVTGVVGFTGEGEWMLVFNEVKVYWDGQGDQDFAMKKSDYVSRVYSPVGPFTGTPAQGLNYTGVIHAPEFTPDGVDNISGPAQFDKPLMMPTGTNMVPRLFITDIGDIMTLNTIKLTDVNNPNPAELQVGVKLTINATDGYLRPLTEREKNGQDEVDQVWMISKVYTMPDGQPGVKVIRTK